ncbi:hypothetical protein SDRG_16551 [Saprolegnia diclina VS20]|uniref:Uncharacterized protein n=1 Tax=Saprolegnia diclina (strain VS20) TaxID=1156394 RepID=T0PTM7_SAPDV|nr:hypothetical protein SDRG_16551 [Saprolegnia diclina VS20]EQC25581.1 hypothetical protein SDRG_16551 [Saprolegnia diclina VS20]|eukprot:XP_008620988.1 hypothetical protein SDRG_16551 [Saprolegnia diclina VS20]
MDARASQLLEPVRVPPKLLDRVEKAQKRLLNKDAFFFDSKPSAASPNARKHLPDVVLRNKMMAFEAKWKCKSKTSLYYDPLDTSLDRLSVEERDLVMNRIQTKVEEITEAVEAKYRRKQAALDTQGVFDHDVNARRVQTMCLVELQRKCNIDRIKEAVLDEFEMERNPLAVKGKPRHASLNVLNVFLKKAEKAEMAGPKKLQRLLRKPRDVEPVQPQESGSNQVVDAAETAAKAPPVVKPEPFKPRAGADELNERQVLLSRHAPVVGIINALRATEAAAKRPKRRQLRVGDDVAAKPVTATDEWTDRPRVFQALGARCAMELHRRSEKVLWDFTAPPIDYSEVVAHLAPLVDAWRRLHLEAHTVNSVASEDDTKLVRLTERRRRQDQNYHKCQDAIKARLRRDHATSAAALPPPPTPNIETAPAEPERNPLQQYRAALLASRPSTILDVRLNQLVHRKLERNPSATRRHPVAKATSSKPTVGRRIEARLAKRREGAMTWEWHMPENMASDSTAEELPPTPRLGAPAPVDASESTVSASPSRTKLQRMMTMTHASDGRASLQARLELVWTQLDVPYHLKLAMMEKYAMQDEPEVFSTALRLWEDAAEVVILREQILTLLRSVHQGWLRNEFQEHMDRLDMDALHRLRIALPLEWSPIVFETWAQAALPLITEECHARADQLHLETADELTFQGHAYRPAL